MEAKQIAYRSFVSSNFQDDVYWIPAARTDPKATPVWAILPGRGVSGPRHYLLAFMQLQAVQSEKSTLNRLNQSCRTFLIQSGNN